MSQPASALAPAAFDAEADAKLSALRRTKFVATARLRSACWSLRWPNRSRARYPWLGFVAAFAEAATIGGLADWYAVVALFKRPLGLPIPHTAIIPENQNRIADNLGRFIEVNFLAPGAGARKARRGRFFRARRRLAVGCRARRRPVAFRRPAGAADACGDRAIRPARLRHQPHAGADRKGAAGAARRRIAVGPDRRPPPPETVRRIHQGRRPVPERRGGAGDDAREDPRGIAVAVQPVSRRRLSVEEDRRLRRLAARRGEGRSRSPDARRIRPLRGKLHRAAAGNRSNMPSAPRS